MIAICISTYNRPTTLRKSLLRHLMYLPQGAKLFIVDDASTIGSPIDNPDIIYIKNKENMGVAATKNKCLELAYNYGAEHIFLFDDDCYPIDKDWWRPYVEDPEPHLMYMFQGKGQKPPVNTGAHMVYSYTKGCMLYFKREVLDKVGGFDTRFGKGMGEHTDLTDRIYMAGLTTHRVMDVINSHLYICSLDETRAVKSTFSDEDRKRLIKENLPLRQGRKKTEYIEFRSNK